MVSRLLMALPMLAITAFAIMQAGTLLQQSLSFTGAQTEISFWGRGDYQPGQETVERIGRSIATQLQSAPEHPEYLALQANYAQWRAYWARGMEDQSRFAGLAVNSQYAALESRPAHRHSWSKMVEYASGSTTGEAMLHKAEARLRELQPERI